MLGAPPHGAISRGVGPAALLSPAGSLHVLLRDDGRLPVGRARGALGSGGVSGSRWIARRERLLHGIVQLLVGRLALFPWPSPRHFAQPFVGSFGWRCLRAAWHVAYSREERIEGWKRNALARAKFRIKRGCNQKRPPDGDRGRSNAITISAAEGRIAMARRFSRSASKESSGPNRDPKAGTRRNLG